jgi:hypothetical protein
MKLPRLNWPIVAFAFIACSTLLFLGHWLWQRNAIDRPLLEKLSQIEGIAEAVLDNSDQGQRIRLTADQSIDFLSAAPQVQQLLQQNDVPAKVIWPTDDAPELLEARRGLDFILREAQIRHEYVTMGERAEQELCFSPVTYQLGVDERFIYLKLQHQQHIWLEVLPVILPGGASR